MKRLFLIGILFVFIIILSVCQSVYNQLGYTPSEAYLSNFCSKAENKNACELIEKSSYNLCDTYTENCETVNNDTWSYLLPSKETTTIDPIECEKLSFSSYYKERCLTASAFDSKNKETCNLISYERNKWVCVIGSATSENDCNDIPKNKKMSTGDHFSFVKDECLLSLALRDKDIKLCTKDSNKNEAGWCISTIVSNYGVDKTVCDSLSTTSTPGKSYYTTEYDACYYGLAQFNKDVSTCSSIKTNYLKAECIGKVGTINDCDNIPDNIMEEGSYYSMSDGCVFAQINKIQDVNFCSHTTTNEGHDFCVDLYVRITGDKQPCELIKNAQLKTTCKRQATLND